MVKLATKETGINVLHSTFQDIDFKKSFDGVWAQATLLHVPYNETTNIYKKVHAALKPEGIFYASYGYGSDIIQRDARDFYNMNEDTIKPYFNGLFEVVKIWTEKSKRFSPSKEALWLNFIVKKVKQLIRLVYLFVILIISFKIYAKEHTGLTYSRYEKDKHIIHVLTIDLKNFELKLVKAHNQVIGRETVDAIARRTNAVAAINAGFFEIAGSDDGRPSLTLMVNGKLFSLRKQLQSLLIIDQNNIQITKASAKISVDIGDKSIIPNQVNYFSNPKDM
ncbi:MAG: methyltransferase domain-containing protein [Rickettsia hoogstraalii]